MPPLSPSSAQRRARRTGSARGWRAGRSAERGDAGRSQHESRRSRGGVSGEGEEECATAKGMVEGLGPKQQSRRSGERERRVRRCSESEADAAELESTPRQPPDRMFERGEAEQPESRRRPCRQCTCTQIPRDCIEAAHASAFERGFRRTWGGCTAVAIVDGPLRLFVLGCRRTER